MVQFDLLPCFPRVYPWEFASFSFPGGLFPTPELLIDLIYDFLGVHLFESDSDFCTIAKRDVFRNFINIF